VEPVARGLATDRAEVIAFARSADPAFWSEPSVVEGWTNHDLLAHLAGGNDQLLQIILRAVTSRRALERGALDPNTDAENEQRVAERRSWTIEALIEELQRDGHEVQELMSRLMNSDRDVMLADSTMSLGNFLRIVEHERHDHLHLDQLRSSAL
jgi:hypothetical protein